MGLAAILLRDFGVLQIFSSPVLPVTLIIVGNSGIISTLLPYAAENYPVRVRGRATGWVAGFRKVGGVFAQILGVLALVPTLDFAAIGVAVPCVLSVVFIALIGRETHKRDLRELEGMRTIDPTLGAD